MDWLDHPAVQGGVAPLVLALVAGAVLGGSRRFGRTPVAWLAVVVGYLASQWLATGLQFSPLTASRKIVLIVLVASGAGLVADLVRHRSRTLDVAFVTAAAASAIWAFWSIVSQRDGFAAAGFALTIGAYVGVMTWLLVRHAEDGIRTGAIGVGLGVATGVAAVLSASIGFLISAVSVAAGSGALLLVQVLGRRTLPAGYTGTLGIGVGCALFAEGAVLLAQMPWYVLPLLLAIPLAVGALDPRRLRPMARASVLAGIALAIGLLPAIAAWHAARGGST
jgi:hypothetical protein